MFSAHLPLVNTTAEKKLVSLQLLLLLVQHVVEKMLSRQLQSTGVAKEMLEVMMLTLELHLGVSILELVKHI